MKKETGWRLMPGGMPKVVTAAQRIPAAVYLDDLVHIIVQVRMGPGSAFYTHHICSPL